MLFTSFLRLLFACSDYSHWSLFRHRTCGKRPILRKVPETRELIETHFNSLHRVMLSIVRFVTVDGIADIYEPLITHRGFLCIYFGLEIVSKDNLLDLVSALDPEG